MQFADRDPMMAARAYVHEIGHVFGIDHPCDGGLMDPCVYHRNSPTCEIGTEKVKPISHNDAERARTCTSEAHAQREYRPPPARSNKPPN